MIPNPHILYSQGGGCLGSHWLVHNISLMQISDLLQGCPNNSDMDLLQQDYDKVDNTRL